MFGAYSRLCILAPHKTQKTDTKTKTQSAHSVLKYTKPGQRVLYVAIIRSLLHFKRSVADDSIRRHHFIVKGPSTRQRGVRVDEKDESENVRWIRKERSKMQKLA